VIGIRRLLSEDDIAIVSEVALGNEGTTFFMIHGCLANSGIGGDN
jgi:hypothetical protein